MRLAAALLLSATARAATLGDVTSALREARAGASAVPAAAPAAAARVITVDFGAARRPFPHFWERMFGSERGNVTLREAWRKDLRAAKSVTGFEYVRFHAILHDENGVYAEDANGQPVYNFSYVDQIYDGLLSSGARPFVELSFMPTKLASDPGATTFWYNGNTSPPKDWTKWERLVEAFGRHLVQRYGEREVARWWFEVWNEPNIHFWSGSPKEETYYELYDHAAQALKRVSPRLRVGGPSTAQAAWVDRFIAHCAQKKVPVDFVSTHVYANDEPENVFGTTQPIPRDKMVCAAARKVHEQVRASAMPALPIIWSEFGASFFNEPAVSDAAFMGPWLADTIRQCDGLADIMSYWTFSDVFEEGGPAQEPFYGGFGMIASGNVPKPAFNAFALLHRLGEERVELPASVPALATRRADGALVVALWNLALPEQAGVPLPVVLKLKGARGRRRAAVTVVDRDHGSPLPAYEAMGRPKYPTPAQLQALRAAAALPSPRTAAVRGDELALTLPPHALALIELR